MVYIWQVIGVWNENLCHKAMNLEVSELFTTIVQVDKRISILVFLQPHNSSLI